MPEPDFIALLQEAIGLDAGSLGPSAVARAVRQRQRACAIADTLDYWARVRSSPAELQELIEVVVVPETWFFRDPEAFAALATMARARLSQYPPAAPLRLLSLPCSSGEEPFSMAMALLDAGIGADRFHIDAIDISRHALGLCAQASYGANSFRAQDLEFRARHFRAAGDGRWQLDDAVRDRVQFRHGNLFATDDMAGVGRYDFVFCRNVLIYFSQADQARAVDVLLRLLAPGGGLFVGPSETGLLPRDRLESAQLPMAFAFRPRADAAPAVASDAPPARPRRIAPPPPTPRTFHAAVARSRDTPREPSLASVQALADAGRLVEAAAACEEQLRRAGPSAAAYCLLGVIRDAGGDADAATACYRKALYLDPANQEALSHLAFLLERQGRLAGARVLRDRLRRLADGVAG